MPPLPTARALRYVTPLREGGSLPAIVETDRGLAVVKFRGAGQGARALVAELIVGGIAQALGLPLPEMTLVEAGDDFGQAEPDPEIQDILRGSRGLNVGLGYIEGAFPYDPVAASDLVAPDLAADIVWLDALTTNIDRTARNPNLLVARGETDAEARLWLIDHGAALYFHHNWDAVDTARARAPFAPIRDHVLLPIAGSITEADARLVDRLGEREIERVLAQIPDALFMDAPDGRTPPFGSAEANREAYARYLRDRLGAPRAWVEATEAARLALADTDDAPLAYRR
ncbi:MAG: HipA family kinase [Bacteroidota bacterium]